MLIKDLFSRRGIAPKGVLHVGAHLAQERFIYHDAGVPFEKMFWVEANPDIYKKLVDIVGVDQAFGLCVSDTDGDIVEFKISNNEGQSSSFLDFGTHLQQHPSVRFTHSIPRATSRLEHLKGKVEADFLVMDLQGAELKALKGMGAWLNDFQWAYLEVNREEVYKGCGLVYDVDAYLEDFGFERVESKWAGGWGDALYTKTF